jgi:hypothetical protein
MDDIRSDPCRKEFPEDIWEVQGWSDQMTAPKRLLSEKGDRYIWHEGNAEDHYRFADAYQRVALDLYTKGGDYIAG